MNLVSIAYTLDSTHNPEAIKYRTKEVYLTIVNVRHNRGHDTDKRTLEVFDEHAPNHFRDPHFLHG